MLHSRTMEKNREKRPILTVSAPAAPALVTRAATAAVPLLCVVVALLSLVSAARAAEDVVTEGLIKATLVDPPPGLHSAPALGAATRGGSNGDEINGNSGQGNGNGSSGTGGDSSDSSDATGSSTDSNVNSTDGDASSKLANPAAAAAAAAAAVTDAADATIAKQQQQQQREGRGLKETLASASTALKGFNQLNALMGSVNVSEISEASTRVARELSKSLNVDVFAVGKALAGAGAALGTTVFLGGMAALLATGLGFFNYSPRLFDSDVGGIGGGSGAAGGFPGHHYYLSSPAAGQYQNRVGGRLLYPGILGQAQQAIIGRVQQAQAAYEAAQVGRAHGRPGLAFPIPNRANGLAGPTAAAAGDPTRAGGLQSGPSTRQNDVVPFEVSPHQQQLPVYHGSDATSDGSRRGPPAPFGEVSARTARTARLLEEVKQPANPDLLPAIRDLLDKLGEAANSIGPQVMAVAAAAARRR